MTPQPLPRYRPTASGKSSDAKPRTETPQARSASGLPDGGTLPRRCSPLNQPEGLRTRSPTHWQGPPAGGTGRGGRPGVDLETPDNTAIRIFPSTSPDQSLTSKPN